MSLIDYQDVVRSQKRIALQFGQQDAIGHELDVGFRAGLIVKPDFAAYFTSVCCVELFRDTARDGKCRDTPGLGAADGGFNAQAGFQTHLGNLRRFARARLTANHNHLVLANGLNNLILAGDDRQPGWISDLRHPGPTALAQIH